MNKSEQYFDKAKKVMPGGVNSPVRAFKSVDRTPLFIDYARGSKIWDVDGNEYTDFVGSWGPLILGHANDRVVRAVSEAAAKGTSYGAPTFGEIQLAEKIIDMVPSIEMVRLVNSGTEATMSAIRAARGHTGRDKIIKFEGCYHGHGDSFLIKAGSGALTLGEPTSPGVPKGVAQDTLTADYNDLASVKALFEANDGQIAGVIVEPVAGNMGVIPPADGFLQGLRSLCDEHGSVLIFDEVMTGFRVAPGGAQELYNVMPDLTTMGKVIGGGLPVGAYGGNKEIMQKISPAGPIYQAGTLSGNPLAVAAGLATLNIISQPSFFVDLSRDACEFFESTKTWIAENDLPLSLNYVNSMGCLYFKRGGVSSFKDAFESDTKLFTQFFGKLLDRGVYIAPSQFEAMFISSAHSGSALARVGKTIREVLEEIL